MLHVHVCHNAIVREEKGIEVRETCRGRRYLYQSLTYVCLGGESQTYVDGERQAAGHRASG